MSVLINVIGRLGNDSEVIDGKNGKFLSFSLATDDFKGGEKTTSWFRVAFNGERAIKMAEWLKKGRLVNVCGTETLSLYTDKSGSTQISRDINAFTVDFVSSGNSGQTQTTSTATEEIPVTTGKLKEPKTKKKEEPPVVTSEPEDDLPF
jgi:single-stranded DNA-binding protein